MEIGIEDSSKAKEEIHKCDKDEEEHFFVIKEKRYIGRNFSLKNEGPSNTKTSTNSGSVK